MSSCSRHVEVVYCDDIREEIGNKVSYMGIYTQDLFVPTSPMILPKLCIAVSVVTGSDDPFKEMEVRVLKGNDRTELLTTGPILIPDAPRDADGGNGILAMQLAFVLSPFEIDGETVLRIQARTEREELKGRALRIRIAPPAE